MEVNEKVLNYMDELSMKYVKNANDFIVGLARRTDKSYAKKVADELNARAKGIETGQQFYSIKNESLSGSLYISSAFDGGVFRHIGNLIVNNPQYFQGKILDLGCDCGLVSCFIAKCYPQSYVVGVDCNENAVNVAKELAKKLELTNTKFICKNVLDEFEQKDYDTITSFRTLLDVCKKSTKSLPVFGIRADREAQYENAFSPYAINISSALKDNGCFVSVERFTANYGWLGWMQALETAGLTINSEFCDEMRASDISSVKEYSVTFAQKAGESNNAFEAYNVLMNKSFKSGAGCVDAQAEYAFYYDTVTTIKNIIIYKDDVPVHQIALTENAQGKLMFYEASSKSKKLKYANKKKQDALLKTIEDMISLVDKSVYKIDSIS